MTSSATHAGGSGAPTGAPTEAPFLPPPPITLRVNGHTHVVRPGSGATLLHVLRNDLALNGPKYGCGLGQCGACTVLVDGVAARSCVMPADGAGARAVTTLEGLGTLAAPHPVQQAFIDEQAAQCGYCLNGMVMAAAALLAREPQPSDAAIRAALAGNLCRCGTHVQIVRAVQRAAVLLRDAHATARAVGSSMEAAAPSA